MEDIDRLRHKLDDNRISLNEDLRKKELADDKLRKEMRSKERLARNQEEPRIYRADTRHGGQAESPIDHVSRKTGRGEEERSSQKSTLKPRRMQIRI